MWRFRLPAMAVVFTAIVSVTSADSIWERRDPRNAYLFQDNRARSVGDILTVSISESTSANERETRATDRRNRDDNSIAYTGDYTFGTRSTAAGKLNMNWASSFRNRFDGSAQLTASRTFTDYIAVTIVDVMPNGNLVFEGYRTRVVSGEERVLRLTGVVRQADIGASNTVLSRYVANLKVSYVGRGQASEYVNQGFMARVLNFILP